MERKREQVVHSRLGTLRVDTEMVLRFPRGLIGFEQLRDFVLVDFKPGTPFRFLQSLEEPEVGFLVADPFAFLHHYEVHVGAAEEKLLRLRSVRDMAVLVVVTVPKGHPEEASLNLLGPLCLNVCERIGLQVPQSHIAAGKVLLRECGPGLVAAQGGG